MFFDHEINLEISEREISKKPQILEILSHWNFKREN